MLRKNQKRFIIYFIALIVSTLIWHVNYNIFNNTFVVCLILSTTTFLIIITPFEIYFSFRDLWFQRWGDIVIDSLKIEKVVIPVKDGKIIGKIIRRNLTTNIKSKKKIVIINPGFSDTKEDMQFLSYPLADQGYTVLVYDSRGTGESKDLGERGDFFAKLDDFEDIINWVENFYPLSDYKIYSIGFSIGAVVSLCRGFSDKRIKKIIAISALSNYNENIPKNNPIVFLTYKLKGVKLFLNELENTKLSPYKVFKDKKEHLSPEKWVNYSDKVFLIHCKNDKLIKFKNFQENSEILNLKEDNKLILKKGGHSLKKDELMLTTSCLRVLNK